jgi:hypothetical protein
LTGSLFTKRPGRCMLGRLIVLPGTEGAQGYRDYGFHFRAFLKGVAGSLVASLLIAGVASVINAVVS